MGNGYMGLLKQCVGVRGLSEWESHLVVVAVVLVEGSPQVLHKTLPLRHQLVHLRTHSEQCDSSPHKDRPVWLWPTCASSWSLSPSAAARADCSRSS